MPSVGQVISLYTGPVTSSGSLEIQSGQESRWVHLNPGLEPADRLLVELNLFRPPLRTGSPSTVP